MRQRTALADAIAELLRTRRWVVASRLTDRLKAQGYTLAVSQKQFDLVKAEAQRMLAGEPVYTLGYGRSSLKSKPGWFVKLGPPHGMKRTLTSSRGRPTRYSTVESARRAQFKLIAARATE